MVNNLVGFIYENGTKTIVFVDDSTYIDFPDNCRLDIKLPSSEEIIPIMDTYARLGFPGAFCSKDVTHIYLGMQK